MARSDEATVGFRRWRVGEVLGKFAGQRLQRGAEAISSLLLAVCDLVAQDSANDDGDHRGPGEVGAEHERYSNQQAEPTRKTDERNNPAMLGDPDRQPVAAPLGKNRETDRSIVLSDHRPP
jgi:hypothetical protein